MLAAFITFLGIAASRLAAAFTRLLCRQKNFVRLTGLSL